MNTLQRITIALMVGGVLVFGQTARIPDKLIQQMVKAQLNQRRAGDKVDSAVKEADGWCRARGMVLLPAKDGIAADCGPDPKAQAQQDMGRPLPPPNTTTNH